ncbi:MFS transporter [Streptomyces sp. NPDC088387]|uniref:MFS transporter n=1 Tax=Streptomyces sp. NPDC088387 TaxID=3365859 RepID=UPI0038306241
MRRLPVLAGSITGAVVVAFDGTVLTVARPSLQEELGASLAQVQWASTGYLVAVAGLLVFAGRLGDRYGHQRLFGIGMLGFGVTSAALAVAPGINWVVGLRVVQGVFGALLQPATLGMLRTAYPPDALRRPIALRTAAIGVAAAVGPVAGGALVTGPGWRTVFLVGVLPTVAFGALALRGAAPRPKAPPAPLDLPGALLLAVTLGSLVHTLVALPDTGWTAANTVAAAVVAVAGSAFVRHERRAASPLVPPALVWSSAVGAPLGMLVAVSAALQGTLFGCVYLLQGPLGLDPFQSALRSVPLAVLMIAAAAGSAVLLRRFGARRTATVAAAVLAAGITVLSQASGTFALCTGFALAGAGFGTVMVAGTHAVVQRAPAESAGVAGGLQQTALNVGPVLGMAVTAALMAAGGVRAGLLPMAVLAVAGMTAACALPGATGAAPGDHGRTADPARAPARR